MSAIIEYEIDERIVCLVDTLIYSWKEFIQILVRVCSERKFGGSLNIGVIIVFFQDVGYISLSMIIFAKLWNCSHRLFEHFRNT